jgi:hypothetical protein
VVAFFKKNVTHALAVVALKHDFATLALAAVRVARWFLFKPKIQIWVNFLGPYNGKRCILRPFSM